MRRTTPETEEEVDNEGLEENEGEGLSGVRKHRGSSNQGSNRTQGTRGTVDRGTTGRLARTRMRVLRGWPG